MPAGKAHVSFIITVQGRYIFHRNFKYHENHSNDQGFTFKPEMEREDVCVCHDLVNTTGRGCGGNVIYS